MSKKDTAHAEIATPIQTIGTIKRVVQGLYSYGKPASAKSIAPHVGMNYTEIGKTFSDARTLGLVAPAEERGHYLLTDEGRELALLLIHGKEEESQNLVAEQILGSPAWSDIVGFLDSVREACEVSDLVLFVEKKHPRTWNRNRRIKAEAAYRSILLYANLMRMEGNKLSPTQDAKRPRSAPAVTERTGEHVPTQAPQKRVPPVSAVETETALSEYVEFSVPDAFILFVKKSGNALEILRRQLVNESMLNHWLDEIEKLGRARSETSSSE